MKGATSRGIAAVFFMAFIALGHGFVPTRPLFRPSNKAMVRSWFRRSASLLPAPSTWPGAARARTFTSSLACHDKNEEKQIEAMLREKIRVKRAGQDEPQSPLLAGLNEAQKQAVTAPIAPIIVLAGPGSGKTRVLTSRIGYLISKGATQDSIVAVTFTNKAAKEMKQRIKSLLDIQHDSMLAITVGTFHYVCI
ncbi:hypothetical protein GUITHDRAFT_150403, partial [Guillardia theta CCMP2712]